MEDLELQPNETVSMVFHLSWVYLVQYVLVAAAAGAGSALSEWVAINATLPNAARDFGLFGSGLAGLAAVILLVGYLVYRRNLLVITNARVIVLRKRALFGTDSQTLSLSVVTNGEYVIDSIPGGILNYGRVTVQTGGGRDDYLQFGPVYAPKDVAEKVTNAARPVPAV